MTGLSTIAIAFDGSQGSQAALRWAATLAEAADAELSALSAFVQPPSETTLALHDELLNDYRLALGEHGLAEAIPLFISDGDPRLTLSTTAATREYDLIVLGRAGHGSEPGLFHVGSVVEYVAHHSNTPLAVIPLDTTLSSEPGPVVLGLDGSPESACASSMAALVAHVLGVEVIAAHIRQPHGGNDRVSAVAHLDDAERRRIDQWSQPLRSSPVTTTAISLVDADPAVAILELAAEKNASMVVIGTRGTGGFTGLRFGGQAMRALHRATLPLLLVPPRRAEPLP